MINRQRHGAVFLRTLAEREVRLRRLAQKIFQSQAKRVASAYLKGSAIDAQEVAKGYESKWQWVLSTHYGLTIKVFSKYTQDQIGALTQKAPRTFRDIIFEFIATESLKKAKAINDSTINLIRKILFKGVEEGQGSTEIGRNLRERIKGLGETRSHRIARTETHNAATFSSQVTAEASGLTLIKEWVTANDERARESHQRADGQKRGLKENFLVGGELISRPGEGSAGNAVNCRCSVVYSHGT